MIQKLAFILLFIHVSVSTAFTNFELSDPCLLSHCGFGELCMRSTNSPTGFSCINENAIKISLTRAQPIQLLSFKIRKDNNNDRITMLRMSSAPKNITKDACADDPCIEGYRCVLVDKTENEDGFECIKNDSLEMELNQNGESLVQTEEKEVVIEQPLNNTEKETTTTTTTTTSTTTPTLLEPHSERLVGNSNERNQVEELVVVSNEELRKQIIEKCRTLSKGRKRVEHPENAHQFVVCLPDSQFTVFDCPDNLYYNKHWDRCDYSLDTFSSGCQSIPCQYGGKCVDIENDMYKCECREGYSGYNCEIAPDICAVKDRCGLNGVCHSLPATSAVPFYCTCFNNKMYGMSCEKASVNPCLGNTDRERIFESSIDRYVFVHCINDRINLKYCLNLDHFKADVGMRELGEKCEWLELNNMKLVSTRHHQLKSYFDSLRK